MHPEDTDSEYDRTSLERRLDAVERALADDDPLDGHTDRLDELDARVAELEAAVQALRGYVGSVRAVNEEIEQRADVALRKATALQRHVDGGDADEKTDDEDDLRGLARLREAL